jgi:hypothetical protein
MPLEAALKKPKKVGWRACTGVPGRAGLSGSSHRVLSLHRWPSHGTRKTTDSVAFYIAEPPSGSTDSAEKCVDDRINLSWDADHADILSGVRHCDVTVRVSLSYFESEGTHARAFNCSSYRFCPERSW